MQRGIIAEGVKGLAALATLAAKITDNEKAKRDYVTDTSNLQMSVGEDGKTVALTVPDPDRGLIQLPVQQLAHRQIGGRVGIHANYYDRMLAEAPDLLAVNVNHWFTSKPERRMVRTLRGSTRSFLSDRYQRIEHEEIAAVALPILQTIPDIQIVSCEITERRMYIQAVTPSVMGQVKVGDEVQAGVTISNSEVGAGAVEVSGLIWRLRCLNGAKMPDPLRRYHVGRQVEDADAMWRDDTRKADDRAVLLKVRDMVASCIDAVIFKKRLDAMQGLAAAPITGTVSKVVEVLAKKIGVTQVEQANILDALIKGQDLTAWGVVNAVTSLAHTAANYDRAVDLEEIGGNLIQAPASEWRQVLQAA